MLNGDVVCTLVLSSGVLGHANGSLIVFNIERVVVSVYVST